MQRFVKARVDRLDEHPARAVPVILDLATLYFAPFSTERARDAYFNEDGYPVDNASIKELIFTRGAPFENLRPEGEPE